MKFGTIENYKQPIHTFKNVVCVKIRDSCVTTRVSHCTAQRKISEDRKLSSHGPEHRTFQEAFICVYRAILLEINTADHMITVDFNEIL
jgi:hypothetical protein